MFSRVDKGLFPKRRWKGVTKTPQSLGWLAQRAAPQVVRMERQSFPFSPMASVSRHCMPLACNCWMEQACLAGLHLPDCCRAAVLCLCYDGSTVGFGLLDAGGILSFCFANKHHSVSLSFPGGTGTESLGLFNDFSGFWLVLVESHLEVWDLLPAAGIKEGSSHQ